jgi:hypothetical protein
MIINNAFKVVCNYAKDYVYKGTFQTMKTFFIHPTWNDFFSFPLPNFYPFFPPWI